MNLIKIIKMCNSTFLKIIFYNFFFLSICSDYDLIAKSQLNEDNKFEKDIASNFLQARQGLYDNNLSDATKFFEYVLIGDPENERILKQTFVSNYQHGNIDKALNIAEKIEEKNINFSLASEPLIGVLIKDEDWDAVLALLNKVEDDQSNFVFSKGIKILSYLALEQPENALLEIKKLEKHFFVLKQNMHPHLKLFIGQFYELNNKTSEAKKVYLEMLKTNERPSLINLSLIDSLVRTDLKKDALSIVKNNLSETFNKNLIDKKIKEDLYPFRKKISIHYVMSSFILFSSLYSDDHYQSSLLLPRTHLSLLISPDFTIGNYILAEKFYRLKNYNKSLKYINNISSDIIWSQPIFYIKLDIFKVTKTNVEILQILDEKIVSENDSFVQKSKILELVGDIYKNSENYQKAIINYRKAIDKNLFSNDLFRKLGICYEQTSDDLLAEKFFFKALELNPNDAFTLNYLGYWWADEERNLDKAIELITRAVALEPNSGYFADSLGWVFFKMEKFDKAVDWLEKAIQLTPTDPIIADHLGDAYMKVGRRNEAIYKWKHAILLGIDKNEESKIKKKLNKIIKNE